MAPFPLHLALAVSIGLAAAAAVPKRLPTDSFPCTPPEKACFAFNRVLHHESGKCYRLGTQGPCPDGQEFVALEEPYVSSGRVVGGCRSSHKCDSPDRMRMEDGQCYDVVDSPFVNWKLCPYDKNKLVKREMFGTASCCSSKECLRPQKDIIIQPSAPGLCYAPNVDAMLQSDDYPLFRSPLTGIQVSCSEEDRRCFSQDQLYHRETNSCYSPLEACGSSGWVVADRKAFEERRRLEPVCRPAACAPGRVFMAREQQCRALWEVQSALCAGDDLLFDVFGHAHCGRGGSQLAMIATSGVLESGGGCGDVLTRAHSQEYAPGVDQDGQKEIIDLEPSL